MTFDQLKEIYDSKTNPFVELNDIGEIRRQQQSKAACCWQVGTRIGDSGWVQLATYRGCATFVCTEQCYEEALKS